MHKEFVFVWRRERVKNFDLAPAMAYGPITDRMANTGWANACKKAGFDDLNPHDLRHTVGLRLREAGQPEHTISDVLGHSRRGTTMTAHYSQAQIVELHDALERIKEDSGRFNKTLQTLIREARAAKKPARKFHRIPVQNRSNGPTAARKSARVPRSSDNSSTPGEHLARAPRGGKSSVSPTKVPQQRKRA